MYIDQLWKQITRVIRMYIDDIFDMLHMTQKSHWHIGPCHLTIKSLQVIEQFASFISRGRLFQILEPW